jgi:6,7-dimethyl-8-ribityllumazine synthase
MERSGGSEGNKGYEAVEAALRTADVIRQVEARNE